MPPPPAHTNRRARKPNGPESAAAEIDDQTKRLMAAILDFTSLQRHRDASEPTSMKLGHAMQQHGLTARHSSALLTVALYGPMSVTQLAEHQRIKLKAASQTAVELEKAGLLERREDPADRRRTIVAIPKSKKRAIDQGLAARGAHLRRTLDRLTPPQQDALITGIETLTEEMARDHI
jgi:DNA-binding MarR family transcriptional regulator